MNQHESHEQAEPGGHEEGAQSTESTPEDGVAVVERMLSREAMDPNAVASVIQRYPAARSKIVAQLHRTLGNGFVQAVMATPLLAEDVNKPGPPAAESETKRIGPSGLDPDNDPRQVPADFAALPVPIIQLLARSRERMSVFAGKNEDRTFWESMRAISPANLHTLMEIYRGTLSAGLWSMIGQLDHIYTYGTSWGIGFVASSDPRALTRNGQWGFDHPQSVVASEHGGSAHEWYRQATGAGNPGLHLGLDIGAGYHNVHIDPTNPMARVSDGNPGDTTYVPKGWAIYSLPETAAHVLEIHDLTDPSKNAEANRQFLAVSFLDDARSQAGAYADLEANAADYTRDRGRSAATVAKVRTMIAAIAPVVAASHALAMQEDKTSEPERVKVAARVVAVRHDLSVALAELFQHMRKEADGLDAAGYDQVIGWSSGFWQAWPTAEKLLAARKVCRD